MNLPARLLPLLLAAATLPLSQVLFPGCATMIDGPMQHVVVQSQPAGARVFVNGHLIGSTPATAVLSRWGVHRVRIEMPGYKPLEIPLEKKFNVYAGHNVFIGGVWIVVDAMTGAIFQLDVPAKVRTGPGPLVQTGDSAPAILGATTLTITTTFKPDPSAHQIGRLEPVRL